MQYVAPNLLYVKPGVLWPVMLIVPVTNRVDNKVSFLNPMSDYNLQLINMKEARPHDDSSVRQGLEYWVDKYHRVSIVLHMWSHSGFNTYFFRS